MVAANKFPDRIAENKTATILINTTTSNSINLGGCSLVGLIMPSAFTGTSLTFKASNDGTNFYDMYNTSGTQLTVTVATAAARWIALTPSDFAGVKYLQIIGSSQAAERSIGIVTRSL